LIATEFLEEDLGRGGTTARRGWSSSAGCSRERDRRGLHGGGSP